MTAIELTRLLDRLEEEMQALQLWQGVPPAAEAFASQEPFCIDTMGFDQWLQWVFVARLRAMIEARASLPTRSELCPLADEFFKGRASESAPLLEVIAQIDRLLTRA
ncbi:YqcC family protein [Aestuariirhabdus sp. LZHN29]|uniref:YqcC family protein n=1 Tax=Aestuariirhabdus sp. LZHN29 TaxID=3417462 RepID=UPI003CE9DDE0